MVSKVLVKRKMIKSSVQLMVISRELNSLPGVILASTMMCTEANKNMLKDVGLDTEALSTCSATDLVVVVKARDEKAAEQALELTETLLGAESVRRRDADKSLGEALKKLPGANMALISLPGEVAGAAAREALEAGLHVHLFSDNVPIEEEVALKKLATDRGLLMMGPDCGTAIINGVPLGFANVVRRGSIGVIAAAGTGLQEVCCIIDRQRTGVSQGIGLGGRDLSVEVGGIMMLAAMEALEKDPGTNVIVLISKPPATDVLGSILDRARSCAKPVVINFIGGLADEGPGDGVHMAGTLEDAAMLAVALSREETVDLRGRNEEDSLRQLAVGEGAKLGESQTFIRGLFSGGSTCSEALSMLSKGLRGQLYSNVKFSGSHLLEDANLSQGNVCIDFGDDQFTRGRVHPMIDPSIIQLRLLRESLDPEVAVILMDVLLGYGSHPDPAGAMIPIIREARANAKKDNRYLPVVVSVVGTDRDPQNRKLSVARLRDAGVIVADSNARAVALTLLIAGRGSDREH